MLHRLRTSSAVEQFIKEKYVRRRWLNVELLTPSAREMVRTIDHQRGGSWR